MLLLDSILEEAEKAADLRNDEVVERLFKHFRRKTRCKFCQYKQDYVYCKIQAKRLKRFIRDPYEAYNRWLDDPAKYPSQNVLIQYESRMQEFLKMADEFRASMYKQGQCTCSPFLILSRERQVHGR